LMALNNCAVLPVASLSLIVGKRLMVSSCFLDEFDNAVALSR